jgi:hypothetical protein
MPLTTILGRLFPLHMLQYSLERYVLALIQSKVMCSGARGEKFEHAMLGKLGLHPLDPTTAVHNYRTISRYAS